MSWDEITVLVDRAKTGDRDAFGELVVRFEHSVFCHGVGQGARPA